MKTEKERRIYYQGVVYDICNQLDQHLGLELGEGAVCGTADRPSREVQNKLNEVLKNCAPSPNSRYAAALEVFREYDSELRKLPFDVWLNQRLTGKPGSHS